MPSSSSSWAGHAPIFEVVEGPRLGRVQHDEAEGVRGQLRVAGGAKFITIGVDQEFGDIAADDLAQLANKLPRRVVTPGRAHSQAAVSLARGR